LVEDKIVVGVLSPQEAT